MKTFFATLALAATVADATRIHIEDTAICALDDGACFADAEAELIQAVEDNWAQNVSNETRAAFDDLMYNIFNDTVQAFQDNGDLASLLIPFSAILGVEDPSSVTPEEIERGALYILGDFEPADYVEFVLANEESNGIELLRERLVHLASLQ